MIADTTPEGRRESDSPERVDVVAGLELGWEEEEAEEAEEEQVCELMVTVAVLAVSRSSYRCLLHTVGLAWRYRVQGLVTAAGPMPIEIRESRRRKGYGRSGMCRSVGGSDVAAGNKVTVRNAAQCTAVMCGRLKLAERPEYSAYDLIS